MDIGFLISVNPGDALPLYRQIVNAVRAACAGGQLTRGDKLPSHRDLATHLVIAPLTVKKAYDTLVAEGVIEYRRGRGTFVTLNDIPREEADRRLEDLSVDLVRQARLMGVSREEVLGHVDRQWNKQEDTPS